MRYYIHFPEPNTPKNNLHKALIKRIVNFDGRIVSDIDAFKREIANNVTYLNRVHCRCAPLDNDRSWEGSKGSVVLGFSNSWVCTLILYPIKEK